MLLKIKQEQLSEWVCKCLMEIICLPHELLLTGRQKRKLRDAFENNISTDVKLSKDQISIFLGSLLSKLAGPLMKVAVPLARTILDPLGITAAASAIDARIKK